jgi:hypothetical protein
MSYILVISCQRSGTNYFLNQMKKVDGLQSFGELFHRNGVYPLTIDDEKYKEKLFHSLLENNNQAFLEGEISMINAGLFGNDKEQAMSFFSSFSHREPSKFIHNCMKIADENIMFKIFPEHLDIDKIKELLNFSCLGVLFLTRNPLDSFISYQKLIETQTPQNIDTSELKINFKVDEYNQYRDEINTFYNNVMSAAEVCKLPTAVIGYDEIHKHERGDVDKAYEYVKIISKSFDLNLKLSLKAEGMLPFNKQDKNDTQDKVNNPEKLPKNILSYDIEEKI